MRYSAFILAATAVLSAVYCNVYVEQKFSSDSWKSHWIHTENPKFNGRFSAGKYFNGEQEDQGLQTSQGGPFYGISSKFKPFSNKDKTLVVQFSVKYGVNVACGGAYMKVFNCELDQKEFPDSSTYEIVFGPNICGDEKKIFLIFRYKGQDYWYNKVIPVKRDVSTHFYTLIVQPDNTYEVLIDNEKVRSANLVDDFDFHTNPEYSPDSSLYMREEFCALGFEIFQDNYGTIFDNILITDDVEYAKNAASNVKTTQSGDCRLSELHEFGWVSHLSDPNKRLYPGDVVVESAAVKYRCTDNYLLVNQNDEILGASFENYCFGGVWIKPVPTCKPFCSTRAISGVTIKASDCSYNGQIVSCLDPSRPGTVARITCAPFYESNGPNAIQQLICDKNGHWSPSPTACVHKCGEQAPKGTPFVVGGRLVNITEVPWHVGIYKLNRNNNGYDISCGGTIVNALVVISAMHCFWNFAYGKPYDPSMFRVVTGKTFTSFIADETLRQEHFRVKELLYDKVEYRDLENHYMADLVMVILDRSIEFHVGISPICIPYELLYEQKTLPPNTVGIVAGYGRIGNNGAVSPQLKSIELPTVDREVCKRETQLELTPDKFCAGYLNLDIGVCEGDSGGGLVFPKVVNGKKKYYLRGIVSTGVKKDGSCDTNKYSTFTNVLHYDKFLFQHDTANRPEL